MMKGTRSADNSSIEMGELKEMMQNLAEKMGTLVGEVTNLKRLDQVVMELKEQLVTNRESGREKTLMEDGPSTARHSDERIHHSKGRIAIDKATQDRTRPSTSRVKVILDLMDKHPKRHLTTENSGDTRQVLVGERLVHEELLVPGTKVQEGLLVPGPKVQLLNISGKSLVDAPKTSDKVQGYTCVISCEDQVGPNAGRVLDRNSIATSKLENSGQQTCQTEVGKQLRYNATEKESVTTTGVARVGSEPTDTTNDKIEIQEKTTNSKAFAVVSQVASEKVLTEDVAINRAATFVAQIKELVQSNIVDKAGVTVDVGAQIVSP
ncbi:hypothetical protein H5410_022185 [Solanum commersonii]|uniref:Uncharacterized protein n=1 Tax=Solanum commersonii TaxID=4109 RepID=A0A9J5ZGE9_SOLCO|nr:hypothetical protein H5410_022185 [Solanum commersonii]